MIFHIIEDGTVTGEVSDDGEEFSWSYDGGNAKVLSKLKQADARLSQTQGEEGLLEDEDGLIDNTTLAPEPASGKLGWAVLHVSLVEGVSVEEQ